MQKNNREKNRVVREKKENVLHLTFDTALNVQCSLESKRKSTRIPGIIT